MEHKWSSFEQIYSDVRSEGFFWLSMAVATGLAAEEIERFYGAAQQTVPTGEMIALFDSCIRSNQISAAETQQAMTWSLHNMRLIDARNRQTTLFQPWPSLALCRGFTAYWLNYKLIELEWQQVLGLDAMTETYQFLDQVLADSAELEEIEGQAAGNQEIDADQKMFLRSHWQRSQLFWNDLYVDLQLMARGLLPIVTR